jgi:O-antigen/teichoic acid export membrane protein
MTIASESAKQVLKERLFKNFSLEFAARIYYLTTRFLLAPITLSYVSLEEYGIWAACFILISYMGMSSMGIANVYIRYVAEYNARNEQEKINRLISTGLMLTTSVCVLLAAGLLLGLPWVLHLLKTPAALAHTASVLILATAGTFMLDLSFGVFNNVLNGLQKNAQTNLVWVLTVTLELIIAVTLLKTGHGIYSLAWAFGIRYIVSTFLMAVCCYRAMPGLSVGWRHFDRSNLNIFFGYGSAVQISGLLCTFLYSIEKVIAGMFVGVQATALFDVGEKLPIMGSQLASSMNSIFMPALSHMNSLTWRDELVKLYMKGARYMNMMTGTLLAFLAAFARPLLHLWIGSSDKFSSAIPILIIFCLPYQTHVLTGPGSAYHRGVGHPKRELVYPFSQLALVLLFVTIGFVTVGKTTLVIAVAVASGMVLSGLIYMSYTHRILGVSQASFLKQVFLPGLIPYSIAFAVSLGSAPLLASAGTSRIHIAGAIFASAIVYLLMVAVVLYRAICPWGEREYLRKQALHSLSGVARALAVSPVRLGRL